MKNRWLFIALGFSMILNLMVGAAVIFSILGNPVVTGNYPTEDINLVARIQRANYIIGVLKRQIESENGKNLPVIISELAGNPNPQISMFGKKILIFMDSRSFTTLTKEETMAVIAHELGHYVLGHKFGQSLKEETEADLFALEYVSAGALSEAILKLSHSEKEKKERLKGITGH